MIALRPYQVDAIERVRQQVRRGVRRVILVAPTGAGKCLAIGTPVMRYDGTIVAVDSVVAGDMLMGPDSTPRRVLSTTRSRGPLVRVTPVKGAPWVCNDVHVLTLVHSVTGEIVDISVDEYAKKSRTWKHCHKQFQPDKGVDFPVQPALPIDPYFLGVWFGDGSKRHDRVAVAKPDAEIAAVMANTAAQWGLKLRTELIPGKCPVYYIAGERGAGNPLLVAMRALIPDVHAIPRAIRVASRAEREQFFAGIIDTDGYAHNNCIEIVQRHIGIADGIAFIARSLGFRVLTTNKIVNGETYHRMSICGDFSAIPTRIARKTCGARLQKKCATRTGFTLEPIGDGEYAGFELDGDGRFLLGDFTVTHNTVMASAIVASALERGTRVLFIAHRRELIGQAFAKFIEFGLPESDVGIIMAGEAGIAAALSARGVKLTSHKLKRPQARVQVASIDTLRNRAMPEDIGLVITDECHRCLAPSYRKLQATYPKANHIGLTATPYRADGKGLGEAYDALVLAASVQQLIDMGSLVEPRVWTVPAEDLPQLGKIRITGGDYDSAQLSAAVDQKGLVGNIVEHWQTHAEGRQTVVFAVDVQHSKHLTARFAEAGVAAEHLDGTTPGAERDAILRRLGNGETRVVVNCGVLCEGWDQPSVKCCVLARPTKSMGLYLQQAGRILRPYKGIGAIILDHSGNVLEHGLPQEDREFSLESKTKSSKKSVGLKTCPSCYAIVAPAVMTCVCGYVWEHSGAPDREEKTAEHDGNLIEVSTATTADMRAEYARLNELATQRGYKPGWVAYQFKEKFGMWPPSAWQAVSAAKATPEEKAAEYERLCAVASAKGYKPGWAIHQYKAKYGSTQGLGLRKRAYRTVQYDEYDHFFPEDDLDSEQAAPLVSVPVPAPKKPRPKPEDHPINEHGYPSEWDISA